MDQQWIIEPLAMFDAIVHPSITDLLPAGTGAYDGVMQDFVVMDDVPYKRPIVDLTKKYNILAARDKSCALVYKQIGTTDLRDIETRQLFAGTQMCKHEFYQGALRDWANKDSETFGNKITPFFLDAVRTDLATNAWFGDDTRTNTGQYAFSVTAFNGIFKWIATYISNGKIAAAQTFTPAATNYRDPANYGDAFAAIDAAWQKQTVLLQNIPGENKVIYCDQAVLDGYRGYVRSLGTTTDKLEVAFGGGMKTLDSYNGIPIVAVPIWAPVLQDMNGNTGYHHAVILTIRRNFIFATDKNYGEGPNNDQALVIWYYQKELSWYYQQFLMAGTQIALPEFIVFGITESI